MNIIELKNRINNEDNMKDKKLLLLTYRGSIAQGLVIDNDKFGVDDVDLIGVTIYKDKNLYLINEVKDKGYQFDFKADSKIIDVVLYDVLHFVNLFLDCNPNVIAPIFCDDNHVLCKDYSIDFWRSNEIRDEIISNKDKFHDTLTGYANSMIDKMNKSSNKYQGYMGEKRKELVDKYGYDIKNATHAIRLLNMLIEILEDKGFYLNRKDIDDDFLKDIKTGKYSLNIILSIIKDKQMRINNILKDMIFYQWSENDYINLKKKMLLPLLK